MRADRLLAMMMLLQSNKRMTAVEIAARLEVSERTIYRDIEALSIAGVPIYTQPGTNGGVFLDEHYRVSLTGLSKDQVVSLFAATEAGPLEDIGLASAVRDSLLKLFANLPTPHQNEVKRMQQRIYIDPAGWYTEGYLPETLHDLQRAVWTDTQVALAYQSVGRGIYAVTVDAYALVSKADRWYLVGRKSNGDFRTYRLTRIQRLDLLETHFDRDETFDLATYWQTSRQQFQQQMAQQFPPYPARLRVHPEMFWYFGSFLEGRFEQVGEADGWLLVDVRFGGIEDARTHVMSLGNAAFVVQPDELRDHVIACVHALIDHYTGQKNG